MPIGSSRYPAGRVIFNLVRSLLNDSVVAAAQVTILSAQRAAGTVFVTTVGPHGLIAPVSSPDQVIISQVPVGVNTFNGTFTVSLVTGPTTFQYVQAGANEIQFGGFAAGVGLGAVFTDPVLLQYVNSAYRSVRRALSMAGTPNFVTDDNYFVIPKVVVIDPSADVPFTDATLPQLPVDLLEPVEIFERQNGTQDDFVQMQNLTSHGGLPSVPQGAVLGFWEWRTDGIFFRGATFDQQIRLRYKRLLLDLVDGTSQVLIPDAQDCIAFLAAAEAALARGSPLAEKWSAAGEDGMEKLIAAATRNQQNSIFRRKPNSSRTGVYGTGGSRDSRGSW
jgi:hypothetical protein